MLKRNLFIGLASLGIAILFLLLVLPNNLGFSDDSMTYLKGAESILEGKGFTFQGSLINHWPPLYSLLLSLTSLIIKEDLVYSGMVLNGVLLFFQSFIFFKILRKLSIDKAIAFVGVFILVFSAPTKVFLWYLSEGLFSVLLLSSIYLILKWIKSNNTWTLYFTGILAGLFMLTRHAGLSFTIAISLSIFILSKGDLYEKIWNVLRFACPAILIFFPWYFYAKSDNTVITSHFINGFLNWKKLEMSKNVIKYWVAGNYFSAKLALLVIAIFVIQVAISYKKFIGLCKSFIEKNRHIHIISLISVITYYLFIIFANSYYNDQIPFDNRILYPIFPFLIINISVFVQFGIRHKVKLSSITIISFFIISSPLSALPVYRDFHNEGLGYMKLKWKESSLIEHISGNENIIYFTNAPEIIELHADKTAILFPIQSRKEELKAIKKKVEKGDAQIVLLKKFPWRKYLVKKDQIMEEFQNFTFHDSNEGIIIKKSSKNK